MLIRPIPLHEPDMIVSRCDLVSLLCPMCYNEVNWRHVDSSFELNGSCCQFVFRSWPANQKLSMYRVESKVADLRNVVQLPRRAALAPQPPTRYG